jgi:UV DNA damage endonuclease
MGEKRGIKYLKQLAIQNIKDLLTILIWNEEHGIRFFRISSNVFPHLGNDILLAKWPKNRYLKGDIKFAAPLLEEVGLFAKQHDHRLTFHANPYIQLGAIDATVLRKSLFDLNTHVEIIKMMKQQPGYSVIVIHAGGRYDSKIETLKRVDKVFSEMSNDMRNCLTLEDDERIYNPLDLLPLCEKWNIPFTLDVFHNKISKDHVKITPEFLNRVFKTWSVRKVPPKMHLSEQKKDDRFGAHSDYLDVIPDWLLKLDILGVPRLDLMIETKMKDLSVLRLLDKYFTKTERKGRVYWILKNKN